MASAVGGTALSNELIIDFTDFAGEPARVTIPLDGAMTDANIALVVDDYAALTNAIIHAKVSRTFDITGTAVAGKPASAAVPLNAAVLGMEFQKVSPLNAAKTPRHERVPRRLRPAAKPGHLVESATRSQVVLKDRIRVARVRSRRCRDTRSRRRASHRPAARPQRPAYPSTCRNRRRSWRCRHAGA